MPFKQDMTPSLGPVCPEQQNLFVVDHLVAVVTSEPSYVIQPLGHRISGAYPTKRPGLPTISPVQNATQQVRGRASVPYLRLRMLVTLFGWVDGQAPLGCGLVCWTSDTPWNSMKHEA